MKPKLLTPLQDYSLKLFAADALAGITVAMVALPLSIAIAIASGAQPAAGLVTAIIGGVLLSALGGSPGQIWGPTRALLVGGSCGVWEYGVDRLLLATGVVCGILFSAGTSRL